MEKKLYKSRTDVKIDGVCAGLAKYFNIDVTLARVLFVVLTFFTGGGGGIVLYIICAIIMPREPQEEVFDSYEPHN